ncbi:MAG: dihydroneopterin aldolase [Bacteroidota bacterium]
MGKLDVIRIKNAVFYAYHGVMSDEQNLGGKFEVDVDLYCNLQEAEETDSLMRTVDYAKVYQKMKDLVVDQKFYLIEALGTRIAKGILQEFLKVQRVVVRVRKHNPPVKGVVDSVEAEIVQERGV